ncbi:hypothetical protein V5P93_003922 [Actinokineospora auranticolor]|uniref:Uncharacterized protein n=1 Tax=Actinokineospora auranticolor TaxID=155976 RepID=A0A2S6GLU0_9PSEU|nr:hypothetical protein [Actinokineospora auranticolor]PPK66204.1 hypothetical protein CLV40_111168 [Actinokineospora auranticolor]
MLDDAADVAAAWVLLDPDRARVAAAMVALARAVPGLEPVRGWTARTLRCLPGAPDTDGEATAVLTGLAEAGIVTREPGRTSRFRLAPPVADHGPTSTAPAAVDRFVDRVARLALVAARVAAPSATLHSPVTPRTPKGLWADPGEARSWLRAEAGLLTAVFVESTRRDEWATVAALAEAWVIWRVQEDPITLEAVLRTALALLTRHSLEDAPSPGWAVVVRASLTARLAHALTDLGRHDDALAACEAAELAADGLLASREGPRLGNWLLASVCSTRARALTAAGRAGEALAAVDTARPLVPAVNTYQHGILFRRRALALHALGMVEDATADTGGTAPTLDEVDRVAVEAARATLLTPPPGPPPAS